MTVPVPIRFPAHVLQALDDFSARGGTPRSTTVIQAVSEWLRMQNHPRIFFATATSGDRRAVLTVGPEVWSVAKAWTDHEPSARRLEEVSDATGIPVPDVEAALNYWADYRDEIDALIERNRADADAAYERWMQRQALNAV